MREFVEKLAAHSEELLQMGVVSLALFGSLVRDEATMGSGIDLLVEFNRAVGLFHFFSVQHRPGELLAVPRVDLVERGAVHPPYTSVFLGRQLMSPRLWHHRVKEILEAMEAKEHCLRRTEVEPSQDNSKDVDAVSMRSMILGESAR